MDRCESTERPLCDEDRLENSVQTLGMACGTENEKVCGGVSSTSFERLDRSGGKRTLLVDNYDSYTHNLYQLVYSVTGWEPIVIRNNDYKAYETLKAKNQLLNIILSPGPGRPDRDQDFGVCRLILEEAVVPVLGVCLGYQGLGLVYGMEVSLS